MNTWVTAIYGKGSIHPTHSIGCLKKTNELLMSDMW